jgi:hypothetical protein
MSNTQHNSTEENTLNNTWNMWYHHEKDNWKITGYRQFYTIKTIEDFWKMFNNWDKVGGITSKHFFLMKKNITPIWEDPNNINGGCWSFKVQEDQAYNLFEELAIHMICDKLCPYSSENNLDEILGLSICLKKNNNVVIKIWNKKSKLNSLKLINENILKKWGMDIIYIAHMSDN